MSDTLVSSHPSGPGEPYVSRNHACCRTKKALPQATRTRPEPGWIFPVKGVDPNKLRIPAFAIRTAAARSGMAIEIMADLSYLTHHAFAHPRPRTPVKRNRLVRPARTPQGRNPRTLIMIVSKRCHSLCSSCTYTSCVSAANLRGLPLFSALQRALGFHDPAPALAGPLRFERAFSTPRRTRGEPNL